MAFADFFPFLNKSGLNEEKKLFGKLIFATKDSHGPIHVFEAKGHRTLTFGTLYEQSCINMCNPHQLSHQYTRGMVLPCFFETPETALVLGFGGGAIPQFLLHYFPALHISAVELRPAMIDTARRHLKLVNTPRLNITIGDAHQFITQSRKTSPEKTYDYICADLYLANGMDLRQASLRFLQQCGALLSPRGWLACNLILPDGIKYDLLSSLLENYSTLYLCNLKTGNAILLASNNDQHLQTSDLPAASARIRDTCGFQLTDYLQNLIRFSL